MAIKNKFIHFKTRAAFNANVPNPALTADEGNTFYNYTTFIQDTKEIYTHGTFYKSNTTWDMLKITEDISYAALFKNNAKVGDIVQLEGAIDFIIFSASIDNSSFMSLLQSTSDINTYNVYYDDSTQLYIFDEDSSLSIANNNNINSIVRSYVEDTYITEKTLEKLPAGTNASITATDSILNAFAKLQGQVNAKANTSSIPTAATVTPKASGTAAVGTSTKYAREDHVHPLQTNVETATKLATPRVIAIAGAVSGSATFNGSSNVSINSTLNGFDASKITSGTLNADRLPEIPISKIPAATSSAYGGIQIGYTTSGKNYAVQLSNGKAYVNVPWTDTNTNYYPTTFTWANGTTAGPTGSLTGSGMSTVSFGAIPSASATQSGVVTTGYQTFGGIKTIDTINVTNINEATPGEGFWIGYNTEGVIRIGKDGDYDFGTSGGTYSGTANTAKRLLNSLQFSNGQSFNGSSAVTIDLPEIPIALPNPYALTINGTSYTGSSAVSISTSEPLRLRMLTSSTVDAGYSYSCGTSRDISTLNGFSSTNPDSVIISSVKLKFTARNTIKMDGLDDLSGEWYIYCLSYMANSKIAVNGAVYAQS